MLDEHRDDLSSREFIITVDFEEKLVVEGDAADPDVEALCDYLPIFFIDKRLLSQDHPQSRLKQILQLRQVNALEKLGSYACFVVSEHVSQLLEFISYVLLLRNKVVLLFFSACVMTLGFIITHAHFALQVSCKIAVLCLRAEARNEHDLDQVCSQV